MILRSTKLLHASGSVSAGTCSLTEVSDTAKTWSGFVCEHSPRKVVEAEDGGDGDCSDGVGNHCRGLLGTTHRSAGTPQLTTRWSNSRYIGSSGSAGVWT